MLDVVWRIAEARGDPVLPFCIDDHFLFLDLCTPFLVIHPLFPLSSHFLTLPFTLRA
jgi:hypothetical protein